MKSILLDVEFEISLPQPITRKAIGKSCLGTSNNLTLRAALVVSIFGELFQSKLSVSLNWAGPIACRRF